MERTRWTDDRIDDLAQDVYRLGDRRGDFREMRAEFGGRSSASCT